jgi:hypothetical protein
VGVTGKLQAASMPASSRQAAKTGIFLGFILGLFSLRVYKTTHFAAIM